MPGSRWLCHCWQGSPITRSLRWLGGLLWKEDALTSVLIFFLGVWPSFPIYMFLYGLFGGWDRDTLAELKELASLTGAIRPLAWLVWSSTAPAVYQPSTWALPHHDPHGCAVGGQGAE